jgi:hypothetical protein
MALFSLPSCWRVSTQLLTAGGYVRSITMRTSKLCCMQQRTCHLDLGHAASRCQRVTPSCLRLCWQQQQSSRSNPCRVWHRKGVQLHPQTPGRL